VIVAATSGAMGGSASEEFLAPLDAGEDTFASCPACGYAANTEAVRTAVPGGQPVGATSGAASAETGGGPAAHAEDTPGTPTIQTLVDVLNARVDLQRSDRPWAAADTLKNVLVMLIRPDGTTEPLAIGLPGDRELDLKRLEAQVAPARVTAFGDADFASRPQLVKGYIGPGSLGQARGMRYLVDPRVVDGSAWVTGADVPGRHVIGLVAGRDFRADGTIDAAEVRDGDPCPECGAGLVLRRGIEIGHIFQLGSKYAEALGLAVAGPGGRPVVVTMGSYGIGVSRAVAAIAESTLDDRGLCWPREVAPADVHLVAAGKDRSVAEFADRVAADLSQEGIRVLYDDRSDVSAGVKFKDAELIGVPTVVVVGKGLAGGVVEVRDRPSGATDLVPAAEIARHLVALCRPGLRV
ncbi:MAG: prolyl-tRNA synthetase, partial [Acidimicrobiaceae bacterium]|nr:prolyl-tRNA synthetase [Acidimicrobiaceae bacterium]